MRDLSSRKDQAASRLHLLRRVLEQLERTFSTEGREGALLVATDLLEHLDDEALRAYAYRQGVRAEDEFEDEAGLDRPAAAPAKG